MAAISSSLMKQLKSSSPRDRYQAIKEIARTRDDSSGTLRLLSDLARNDPDPQVRKVAAKADEYLRGLGTQAASSGEGGGSYMDYEDSPKKPKKRELSAEEEARAKGYVEEALSYQINGEVNKSLKALNKALDLNPLLRDDPYFRSILDSTTGLSGPESLALLEDKQERQNIAVAERQLKREKRQQEHREVVDRSTWPSALMDLTLFFIILVGFTAAQLLVLGESSKMLLNTIAESGGGDIDPAVAMQAASYDTIGFGLAIVIGLIAGVSGVISMVVQLVATHFAARLIFGGIATLPHLFYKVLSFYNGRLPILYIVSMVAIVLTVGLGVPLFGGLVMLGLSIYTLIITLKLIGQIGEAYDFGFAMGCVSMMVGGFLVSLVGFGLSVLMLGSIGAALESMMAGGTF
jgi:hypothetical protein